MNRKQFIVSLLAILTAPLHAFKKREETLQELLDKGGLIKGKTFDITEQLQVTDDHVFRIEECRLNVKRSAFKDGVWWNDSQRTGNARGLVEVTRCKIDMRDGWDSIDIPIKTRCGRLEPMSQHYFARTYKGYNYPLY